MKKKTTFSKPDPIVILLSRLLVAGTVVLVLSEPAYKLANTVYKEFRRQFAWNMADRLCEEYLTPDFYGKIPFRTDYDGETSEEVQRSFDELSYQMAGAINDEVCNGRLPFAFRVEGYLFCDQEEQDRRFHSNVSGWQYMYIADSSKYIGKEFISCDDDYVEKCIGTYAYGREVSRREYIDDHYRFYLYMTPSYDPETGKAEYEDLLQELQALEESDQTKKYDLIEMNYTDGKYLYPGYEIRSMDAEKYQEREEQIKEGGLFSLITGHKDLEWETVKTLDYYPDHSSEGLHYAGRIVESVFRDFSLPYVEDVFSDREFQRVKNLYGYDLILDGFDFDAGDAIIVGKHFSKFHEDGYYNDQNKYVLYFAFPCSLIREHKTAVVAVSVALLILVLAVAVANAHFSYIRQMKRYLDHQKELIIVQKMSGVLNAAELSEFVRSGLRGVRIPKEKIDIGSFFSDYFEGMKEVLAEKNLTLEYKVKKEASIFVNRRLLEDTLGVQIKNIIDHSKSGTVINVSFHQISEDYSDIMIESEYDDKSKKKLRKYVSRYRKGRYLWQALFDNGPELAASVDLLKRMGADCVMRMNQGKAITCTDISFRSKRLNKTVSGDTNANKSEG